MHEKASRNFPFNRPEIVNYRRGSIPPAFSEPIVLRPARRATEVPSPFYEPDAHFLRECSRRRTDLQARLSLASICPTVAARGGARPGTRALLPAAVVFDAAVAPSPESSASDSGRRSDRPPPSRWPRHGSPWNFAREDRLEKRQPVEVSKTGASGDLRRYLSGTMPSPETAKSPIQDILLI